MAPNNIRDLRESKNLSQDAVAAAAGVTYNVYCRIEKVAGKTTPEEVAKVMNVLKEMEPGTRKLAGRPFKDAAKQAAVAAARAAGTSVAEALGLETVAKKAPAKTTHAPKAAAPKADAAAAPKKPRSKTPAKAAAPKADMAAALKKPRARK